MYVNVCDVCGGSHVKVGTVAGWLTPLPPTGDFAACAAEGRTRVGDGFFNHTHACMGCMCVCETVCVSVRQTDRQTDKRTSIVLTPPVRVRCVDVDGVCGPFSDSLPLSVAC